MGDVMTWMPTAILGMIVLLGAATVLIAGLPWVTRREDAMRQTLVSARMDGLETILREMLKLSASNTNNINKLTNMVGILNDRAGRGES